MSADHVITDAKTGKFLCEFCGAQEEPPFMPAPINVIIDAMDVFIEQHKDCKAPAAETVMSEYIKGFDAGYSYVLTEIERWQDEVGADLHVLLSHLKMQDKPLEGK